MSQFAARLISRFAPAVLAMTLAVPGGCGGSDADDGDSGGDGPSWQVSYTGELSGEVSGGLVTFVGTGVMVGVAGRGPEDSSITLNVQLGKGDTGEAMLLPLWLTLADGTECGLDDEPVMGTVSDGDTDSYALDFAGKMECDGAIIEVDGFVRGG